MVRWMRISGILVALAVLAACAAPPSPTPTATPAPVQPQPSPMPAATPTPAVRKVVLGFTASQTGSLTKESKEQVQGLQLWLEHLQQAGGIRLPDGTVLQVELKFYDDESTKERVQQLYVKLITEDKADFLISPYSSGLADAAAVIAEQYGKILITTGAASDSTYEKGYQHVFQIYTPASRYLTGAIDFLKKVDPNAKRIAIIHEKDKFSTDVANAAKPYAESQGFEVVLFEGYESGTTDFGPFINKIMAANPDAIIGGGHFQDGSTLARQLFEKKVPVKMIALLVAPAVPEFAQLGDAAVGVIGPSQWEPGAKYSPDAAKAAGLPWYGPTVEEFVKAYKEKYGYEPGYHAAGGYAAGLVLQKAIEDAGSIETEKVKAALEKMDLMTFYGRIKFDTGKAHGKQIGHEMVYLQWQKDASGNMIRPIIWPEAARAAEPIYPLSR